MSDKTDKLEDEPLVSNPDKTLTSEEITEFFTRVQASERCPICTNTKWYMATTEKFRHAIPTKQSGIVGAAGVGVYVVVCSRCGFVRQHFEGIVEGSFNLDELDQNELEKP